MNRIAPVIALLLVSACERQEQPAAPAATEAAPAPAPTPAVKAAVPSLEGEWRVTAPTPLDLTVKGAQATLSSGCLRRGFTLRQTGNQIAFASAPASSSNCEGQSPDAAQENAFAALADANLAVFGEDGRKVTLSGLGGILTLERR